jgi:Zn-finger nucleic acid-binding protein
MTFTGGLRRELCSACGALWFEAGTLGKVVGKAALERLARQARGAMGQCKRCRGLLEGVPYCPACGEQASACPGCGVGPLAVVEVADVPVDVCSQCGGVALDAGELELLKRAVHAEAESAQAGGHPEPEAPPKKRDVCAGCGRKVEPEHAFVEGQDVWCGSCAPVGASPLVAQLSSRGPGEPIYPYKSPVLLPRTQILYDLSDLFEDALKWLARNLMS